VSQENVELVLSIQPAPDVDVTQLLRDDMIWAAAVETAAPITHPEFESIIRGGPDGDRTYAGTNGMRQMFLDWLAPWAAYRTEIQEAIDCGDQVLVLANTFTLQAQLPTVVILPRRHRSPDPPLARTRTRKEPELPITEPRSRLHPDTLKATPKHPP
jgi:hypothetical protein